MVKKILIIGNWKCNPVLFREAKAFFNSLKKQLKDKKDLKNTKVVVCPPFIYLETIKRYSNNKKIKLGAQNCFWREKGPFTGEISPLMLKNIGCNYVILGHSERREYMGETDEIILDKLKSALKNHLKPILCIGEEKEKRKRGETFDILKEQIKNTVSKLSQSQIIDVVIAYEPVWAIGTGNNCQPNEAMTVLMFIRKELLKLFSKRIVNRVLILYGGSVNSKNAKSYIDVGFDGLLVGGASLKPGEFTRIIKTCSN